MSRRLFCLPLLAALALPVAPAPAFADEMQRLFVCGTGATDNDAITLDAIGHDDGTWGDMQLAIKSDGKANILIPPQPVPGKNNFFFSNSEGPEGYLARVRFVFSGTRYVLQMLDIPPTDGDMGGSAAGLTITSPGGITQQIDCGETTEYIGYMQEAMSCDMTNRYGVDGCDFDVRPTRAEDDKVE